jgi:hypothetical protein
VQLNERCDVPGRSRPAKKVVALLAIARQVPNLKECVADEAGPARGVLRRFGDGPKHTQPFVIPVILSRLVHARDGKPESSSGIPSARQALEHCLLGWATHRPVG